MIPKPPDDIEQVNAFIYACRTNMVADRELVLVILRKDTNEFLGVCGLHGDEQADAPMLGIWLKIGAHGECLGREAIHVLTGWAQQHLVFSYLSYPLDKDNIPSRKIAESLGGVVISTGQRRSMSGNVLNEVVYRIDMK